MNKCTELAELRAALTVGYYRLKHVLTIIPIGASTWWAGVKSGRFPKPVYLGPRIPYWKKSDILTLTSKIIRGDVN